MQVSMQPPMQPSIQEELEAGSFSAEISGFMFFFPSTTDIYIYICTYICMYICTYSLLRFMYTVACWNNSGI